MADSAAPTATVGQANGAPFSTPYASLAEERALQPARVLNADGNASSVSLRLGSADREGELFRLVCRCARSEVSSATGIQGLGGSRGSGLTL